MLFIDTLLLSPIYGAIWAARQVHHAIEQERAAEPARITAELSELYMMLETRRITEAEFDAREKVLLDQLDRLQEPENNHPEEAKHKRKQGPGRVTSGRKAIVKAATMVILSMWICLPSAFADGSSNLANQTATWTPLRLAAPSFVAQISNLSVSPKIVAGDDDFYIGLERRFPTGLGREAGCKPAPRWLRLCRAALYRRLPVGRPFDRREGCGLEIRDTAGWKPALRVAPQLVPANREPARAPSSKCAR